jgi:iron-sulfur cluster repair protein YtfE (RIC family)
VSLVELFHSVIQDGTMLVSLGRKEQTEDLVELLLACHQRIRTFSALAVTIASAADAPEGEVTEACHRCERYFVEALPLHVEDEEVSLLPRLRGLRPALDEALDLMHDEHLAHRPLLQELLAALRAVRGAPSDGEARGRLASAASALEPAFDRHLENEERVVFPAVRELLSPATHAEIVGELRARRQPAMGAGDQGASQ